MLELLVEWVRGEVDTPTPRTNHGVQFRLVLATNIVSWVSEN